MKRLLPAFLALAMSVAGVTCADAVNIRFATQGIGTSPYVYASSMAQVTQPLLPKDARIDIATTGGGTGAPFLIAANRADIAIANAAPTRWAMDGTFPGQPAVKDVNALVGGFDTPFLVIIFTDEFVKKTGITSVEDIVAKKHPVRVAVKTVGGLGEAACHQVFEALGVSYKDIASWGGRVTHTAPMDIVSQLRDGQADMTIDHIPAGQAAISELSMTATVHFIAPSQKVTEYLRDKQGWDTVVMPKGTWKGQEKDITCPSSGVVLLANPKLDAEYAYIITKAICENKPELVAAHASISPFDPTKAWEPAKLGAPLHPGAKRYYVEKGYMKP